MDKTLLFDISEAVEESGFKDNRLASPRTDMMKWDQLALDCDIE